VERSSPSDKTPSDKNGQKRRLLASFAVLAALPTYLALGARHWWVLDLATHFCAFYVFVLLPVSLVLLASKRWRLFVFVASALAINMALLAPLYFGGSVPEDTSVDTQSLRIVSINVLFENSQHEQVLDCIRQERPDLVLLMEVNSSWQPALETLKSQFLYSRVETRKGSFGIALFSQLPLEDLQLLDLGSIGIPSIQATVRVEGVPIQIVGTHFMPPMDGERSRLRNRHLLAAAQELARTPRPRLLLGDLNITPWSPYFRDLLKLGKMRNSQIGFGIQPTWLAALPIDHLLHSDDIAILDRRIGPDIGSDHRPLIVDFAVKKTAP